MSSIEDFIYEFDGDQQEILSYFHELLTTEYNLEPKIRFKLPFYYGKSWICYLNPLKNGKVVLAFVRGNELSNSQHLLESKGRKQVYSISFKQISDVMNELLEEVIQEAILLDQHQPYASKRNKDTDWI